MSFTGPGAATTSMVAATVSSVMLFSASTGVFGRNIYNSSTAICYLTFGTVSSTTAYTTQIPATTNYSFPVPAYSGAVTAVWSATNGSAATSQW